MMKKTISLIILFVMLLSIAGCVANSKEAIVIRFSEIMDEKLRPTERMKSLDGKQVAITGFMAAQSPLNGSFVYLVSMPFVSCPYCSPDSNVLKSVLPVTAGKLPKISFTEKPVLVKGKLEVSDKTDEFGYSSPVRVICESIENVDITTMPQNVKDFMMLANDGVIDEATGQIFGLYNMLGEYYQTSNKNVLKKVELNKITALAKKVRQYNINNFTPLADVLDEFYQVAKLYNETDINSPRDEAFLKIADQSVAVINAYFYWSDRASSIE
jgi:hypothetical protein